MRLAHIAGMLFAAGAIASAQVGTVQNAAAAQIRTAFVSLADFLVTGPVSAELGLLAGFEPNIISPRMLAVLTYPIPASPLNTPVNEPVNATVAIRPVGSGVAIPATVTNAVTGAITFVVPAGIPLGGAELLYQINGGATQWTPLNVVPSSFAFFSNGPGGSATAQTISSGGYASSVGLTTPIQPGGTLQLTGSGLGYGSTVSATIGGMSAPVIYAGASGTQAGRDQILLQVPAGVADGCYVPVVLTYNHTNVTTTVSVTSNGAACRHPWQLSENDMKTLDSGGYLAWGSVELGTQLGVVTAAAGSRTESASLNVGLINAAQIAGYFAASPALYGCNVPIASGGALAPVFVEGIFYAGYPNPPLPTVPDIGSSVTFVSPTATLSMTASGSYFTWANEPAPADGPLSNLPTPAIAGGKWTFQSSGGTDLGASLFNFSLPAPIQLAGGVPVMVNHTLDQTITWNGTAFDAGATAFITLGGGTGLVSCLEPADAGSVTIPAGLLAGFSANTIGTLSISLSEAGAYLPHTEFQLNNHNSLLMTVSFSSSDSRPVFFQ